MAQSHFDPSRYRWREVKGEPGQSYKVHHDYTILGEGRESVHVVHREPRVVDGALDHLAGQRVLRHVADPRGEHRVRRAGDYALTVGDALPHLERGGDEGGIVFFGNHSNDGRLYEILDEDLNLVVDVTMELLIEDWKANT
jgi:hypothetical protein